MLRRMPVLRQDHMIKGLGERHDRRDHGAPVERAISARTAGVVRALAWIAGIRTSSAERAWCTGQSARRIPQSPNVPDPKNVPLPNNYARVLARSGEHSDHKSIILLLTALEDGATVRRWLEDRAFRTQLDKLCDLARGLRTN